MLLVEEKSEVISVRVPKSLKKLINKLTKRRGYVSRGDFIRDAIREKIGRNGDESG